MTEGAGWVGPLSHALQALAMVGADHTEGQGYHVAGDVVPFMGGTAPDNDVLVTPAAVYFVQGRQAPLAPLMADTSYGVPVRVV